MDVDSLRLEPKAGSNPECGVVDGERADVRNRTNQCVYEVEQLVKSRGGTKLLDVLEQPIATLHQGRPRYPPLVG